MSASKKLSSSEISLHTSKNDCWLIIHDKVYDVTNFLDDHPGGDDVLLQAAANGDATQAFEDVGHSSTAMGMIESYLIGSVGDEARKENEPPKPARDHIPEPPKPARDHIPEPPKPARDHIPGPPKQDTPSTNFMDIVLPLLILALAFAAWYYLTYINVNA